jgi:hypothetical protein
MKQTKSCIERHSSSIVKRSDMTDPNSKRELKQEKNDTAVKRGVESAGNDVCEHQRYDVGAVVKDPIEDEDEVLLEEVLGEGDEEEDERDGDGDGDGDGD